MKNEYEHGMRTNFLTSFDKIIVDTPKTAESLSENAMLEPGQQVSFTSIISSVEKFFLCEDAERELFGQEFQKKLVQEEKIPFSCEQIIQRSQNQPNYQLDFKIILQKSTNSHKPQKELNPVSTKKTTLETLKSLSFLIEDEIELFSPRANEQFIMAEFQQDCCPSQILKTESKFILQLLPQGFERTILLLSDQERKENVCFKEDYSVLIKKIHNYKNFVIIFSYAKVQSIKMLKEELRNKSLQLNEVKQIKQLKGILFELCQQNMGSRIIQKLIHLLPKESIQTLEQQLGQKYHLLMKDKYGNYIVQKIFSHFEEDQKLYFLKKVSGQIPSIAKTKFGTYCLQFILKKCNRIQKCLDQILISIKSYISELSMDQFGTHFMQQLLHAQKKSNLLVFFFENENLVKNAKNKYGILTLKSLMSKVCKQTKYNTAKRAQFMNRVYENFDQVVVDEYGHHLIQQLPKYYSAFELNWVFWAVNESLSFYATSQYSSSVIRLYLQTFGYTWTNALIFSIFNIQEVVISLMESKSGSYLIHRLLESSDIFTKQKLLDSLTSLLPSLKSEQRRYKWMKFLKI